ncbi:MAG: hypothetical protein ACR2PQ_11790 [Myxococcota bacterium]
MPRSFCITLSLFALFLLPASTAFGVTIDWTGSVSVVVTDTGGQYTGAAAGDPFGGTFVVGATCGGCTVEPQGGGETNYVFPGGTGDLSAIVLGGSRNTMGSESSINIQDDHPLDPGEVQLVEFFLGNGSAQVGQMIDVWTAASETSNMLLEWEISLVDLDGAIYDDQSYRGNPPPLSEIELFIFSVVETDGGGNDVFEAFGTAQFVPEPHLGALLAAAALCLVRRRR